MSRSAEAAQDSFGQACLQTALLLSLLLSAAVVAVVVVVVAVETRPQMARWRTLLLLDERSPVSKIPEHEPVLVLPLRRTARRSTLVVEQRRSGARPPRLLLPKRLGGTSEET